MVQVNSLVHITICPIFSIEQTNEKKFLERQLVIKEQYTLSLIKISNRFLFSENTLFIHNVTFILYIFQYFIFFISLFNKVFRVKLF